MKRHKILRKICSNCAVSNLSLRSRCISRSLHDPAKVVISWLLTRTCCGLAVVVSVIICLSMMARWRSRRFTVVATLVVVSRSLPLFRSEKSAQRGSFRPDVPADIRPKTRSGPPNAGKKTSILARTCRADVHEKSSV